MLSQHLRELRNFFDATAIASGQMSHENAVMFAEALGCAADLAEQLERMSAPLELGPETEALIQRARTIADAVNVVVLAGRRGDAPRGGAA